MELPPRYQPARALPERAYVPGRGSPPPPQADDSTAAYVPDGRWAEHAEYLWGVDLYNAGFFWEAHEVWESAWRKAEGDPTQHAFLQGLIQCAAACLKSVMEDPDSARRLAARALARLERVQAERGDLYMGLDLTELLRAFRAFEEADPTAIAHRPSLVLVPFPMASTPPSSMRRERLARRARWVIGLIALSGIVYRMAQMFR